MTNSVDSIIEDIKRIQQISIVPQILDVICRTTGLGFAAVARVTDTRWVVCSVRDDINFGLEVGGELVVETTLCHEVRAEMKAIIIDHVAADEVYCNHATPSTYGFQSYISVPIFQKDGSFFGTLCAIDPRPAQLKEKGAEAMFSMFAELIAFHLETVDVMERSYKSIRQLSHQMSLSQNENVQYQFISHHNLAEPLRKMRYFSDAIQLAAKKGDLEKTSEIASKIDQSAKRFSMMLKDLSDYSSLARETFTSVNLSEVLNHVLDQLGEHIEQKNIMVNTVPLPVVKAILIQMERLFFHLINNAIKFSRTEVVPTLTVSFNILTESEKQAFPQAEPDSKYVKIDFKDNGMGIGQIELNKIFNMFAKMSTIKYGIGDDGFGMGLAYCKRIAGIHGGDITVSSTIGEGSVFSVYLAIE